MQSVTPEEGFKNSDGFLTRVHGELQRRVREDQYRAWFRDISVIKFESDSVEFGVRSGFVRDWLTRHFLGDLQHAARCASELARLNVRVSLDENAASLVTTESEGPVNVFAEAPRPARDAAVTRTDPVRVVDVDDDKRDAVAEGLGLNENYTFENFVVGECNRFPHAAAIAIGENPGSAYNPLYIHGNTGLGKTHLLQATCRSIAHKRRGARIAYLSCEEFTNKYIQAIQSGSLDEFRREQRSVDVLVIDDVQFLARKDRTQEEFFHTFNALYDQHKQIVISSDCSPQEIDHLEERLVSRFKWGLVAEMTTPSLQTRVAIVKRKCSALGFDMTDEVAHYIAERITKNMRELEGAVTKVLGMMKLTGKPLGTDLAAEALRGVFLPSRTAPVTAQDIMTLIAEEYSITVRDITGKGRTQTVSLPRQIAMYLTRTLTDLSLEEIGRNYGNRDHTTVLYAVDKIKKRIADDKRFRESIESLVSRLQGGR